MSEKYSAAALEAAMEISRNRGTIEAAAIIIECETRCGELREALSDLFFACALTQSSSNARDKAWAILDATKETAK